MANTIRHISDCMLYQKQGGINITDNNVAVGATARYTASASIMFKTIHNEVRTFLLFGIKESYYDDWDDGK